MQKRKSISIWSVLSSSLIFLSGNDANALGQFSRNCQYAEIPFGLQNISSRFFYAVGAPPYVLDLPSASAADQLKYYIQESITTDYLRFRYLLFAMSWVFDRGGYNGSWRLISERRSTWSAQSINAAMEANPYFRPYYLNRQWLYSARAGDPVIVVYWVGINKGMTLGAHFYYDIAGGRTVRLPDTKAIDCNLTDFGIGKGLWGR